MELLHAWPHEQPALGAIAAAVGIDPSHLARVFRKHHGVSIGAYGRRIRLERAAEQLVKTDRSIAAVAADSGFTDQSHFTSVQALQRAYAGQVPSGAPLGKGRPD